MISLDVENYCHNCPDFEPYCNKLESDNFDGRVDILTLIQCKRKDVCATIKAYIEQENVKEVK